MPAWYDAHPRIWLTNPDGSDNGRIARLKAKPVSSGHGTALQRPAFGGSQEGYAWHTTTAPGNGTLLNHCWQYALKWRISLEAGETEDTVAKTAALGYVNRYTGLNGQSLYSLGTTMTTDNGINDGIHLRNMALLYDWMYPVLSAQQKAGLIDSMMAHIFIRQNQAGIAWNPFYSDAVGIYGCGSGGLADPLFNHYHHSFQGAVYAAVATYGDQPATFHWPPVTGTEYTFGLNFDVTTTGGVESFTGTSALWNWLVGDANHNQAEHMVLPEFTVWCEGGGMPEGINYGSTAMMKCAEVFSLLDQTCGFTFGADHTEVFRDAIKFILYNDQPGHRHLAVINDNSGGSKTVMNESGTWSSGQIENPGRTYEMTRMAMLALADWFNGDSEAEYGQYWLESLTPYLGNGASSEYKPYEFMWRDDARTATDYRDVLPLFYHAPGIGFINSRSSWDDDAVSVVTQCTYKQEEKQHASCNELQIWKRPIPSGRLHAWLVMDATANGLNKDDWESWFHSGYSVFLNQANFVWTNGGHQRQGHGLTPEGITRHCGTTAYVYSQGTADNAFGQYGGTEGTSLGSDVSDKFTREMVHVLPNVIVVFDRMRLKTAFASTNSKIQARFHYPADPSSAGGINDIATVEIDTHRMFRRCVLSTSGTVRTEAADTDLKSASGSAYDVTNAWREMFTCTLSASSAYSRLCNVFEVATTDQASMSPMDATPPTGVNFQNGQTWTMAGVTIKPMQTGSNPRKPGPNPLSPMNPSQPFFGFSHFLFSEQQDATTPSTIAYCVNKGSRYDMHRVFNLAASTSYQVTETQLITTNGKRSGYFKYILTPNASGNVTTNSAGVAEFRPPRVRQATTRELP